ncbi:hypothetical protein J6590_099300 [Homalodisca vitripennis]|nr:hypothetical protein J6590_099300 [Homalodisca vitripennis]
MSVSASSCDVIINSDSMKNETVSSPSFYNPYDPEVTVATTSKEGGRKGVERGNLLFCTVGCGGTVGRREGRVGVVIVADGRFVFLRVPVAIMQWTREERSFCVEAYFSNAHSIIAAQRAFRLRFSVRPRGRVPGRQSIVNGVAYSEQQGMCHVYEGDIREGLQHRKTSIELEQHYCNLQNALLGSNHLLLEFQDVLSTGFFMMN